MRTTRNKQTNTSATIHTLATPHTSNQSASQKISKHFSAQCVKSAPFQT
jgi:hypothetical protein